MGSSLNTTKKAKTGNGNLNMGSKTTDATPCQPSQRRATGSSFSRFFGIAAAAEAAVAGSSRACFAANVEDFDELARKRNSVSVRACAHAHE